MSKICAFIFIFFAGLLQVVGQPHMNISGYVFDASTGERLGGATIYLPVQKTGVVTNEYGYYSMAIFKNEVSVIFRFVGYEPRVINLVLTGDTILNVQLEAKNTIAEINVKAQPGEDFLFSSALGTHYLNARQIESIPAVLGEPDLLKAVQLLPGVTFTSEGSTRFSVRGGNPDQTLIQLDGVPVYNVNHLWGFMSPFNNDAIKDVKLYKGSMPASLGGRLSSVLDVSMKEGNMKEHAGTFSISPIAGRYTLEGPIAKEKASYMVSGRTTWANLLLSAYHKLENQNRESDFLTYGFWDINAKANWIISRNDRMYLSFYSGRDAFVSEDGTDGWNDYVKFSYSWQNLTSVLRWNHIFSKNLFANFSVYNSRFMQVYLSEYDKRGGEYYKGNNILSDWSNKGDFNWYPAWKAEFKFGYQISSQRFRPEIISYQSDTISFELNKDDVSHNYISEIYGQGDFQISERLEGFLGIRAGVISTGENYWSLQPRTSIRYLFSDKISGKASWSHMQQHLHQLENTTIGIPTELWVTSTSRIKPATSDLFSLGLYWKPEIKYQLSGELFYSNMHNVIRYREGTMTIKERDNSWQDFVTQGKGNSYGLEVMAEKTASRFMGWLAYTLSKSNRQYKEINFGKAFPYAYDRRHQITFNGNYIFNEKRKNDMIVSRSLAVNFNFASGRYLTLASQEYQAIPLPLMEGSRYRADWFAKRDLLNEVNNYKMPDFHHLNLSYRIQRIREDKTITWNFSVYNVYNRLNPWYYYKKDDQMKQITLFPIIPSVSFTYSW